MWAELPPFLLLSFKWDGFSWTSSRELVWGIQACAVISFSASQLTPPSSVTTVSVLQYGQLCSQPCSDSLSPAWFGRTSPASSGFPSSLHGPFFHHHAPLDAVSRWHVLLSAISGLPNSFWTLSLSSFPRALEVLSLSYTPHISRSDRMPSFGKQRLVGDGWDPRALWSPLPPFRPLSPLTATSFLCSFTFGVIYMQLSLWVFSIS